MPPKCNIVGDRTSIDSRISCIDSKIKDHVEFTTINIGRRAMLNKFCNYEILRKWFGKKVEVPHARLFSEPKCQAHVAIWYLVYRWTMFLAWLTIVICSIFEIGSYSPKYNWKKWPIYLTNWDLVLGTTQAFFGAFLTTRRWKIQKKSNFDACNLKFNILERIYWFLYVVTSTLAITVTASYWYAVYDPKIHQIDPLNIMLHVCNSILMIIDLCITSIPFKVKNIWWCLVVVMSYLIFSIIYYFAGGLDKHGLHYIYKALDWQKPKRTLLVCLAGLAFLAMVHLLTCLFGKLKDSIYDKMKTNKSSPATRKGVNIV